jgi:hypothetical protein
MEATVSWLGNCNGPSSSTLTAAGARGSLPGDVDGAGCRRRHVVDEHFGEGGGEGGAAHSPATVRLSSTSRLRSAARLLLPLLLPTLPSTPSSAFNNSICARVCSSCARRSSRASIV